MTATLDRFEYAAREFEVVRPPKWREIARPEQLAPEGDWLVWAYVAGRGCVAGDTRVYLPLEDRHERIDVLSAAGQEITVLALTPNGPRPIATDGAPFAKGVAPLCEVATSDGHVITVTDQHRFLGPQGWLRLADVRAGQLLAAGPPGPQQANPCGQSAPPAGGIAWTRVMTVRPVGTGVFYDLTVPGAENYAAEGMWHHNSGKTRSAAEWVNEKAKQNPGVRIALVGRTPADVRDVMIEGESGILACAGKQRPIYESTKRKLTWPNGSTAHAYSAEVPAQLRGPQHHFSWCDEPAAWTDASKGDVLDTAWNNLMLGLRLGSNPQCVATTTPKPNALIRLLLDRKSTVISRGSTYDNLANLAPSFRENVLATYEGTRIGRQELLGELLEDVEGALWTISRIDAGRVLVAPDMQRIVVAVDPSGGSGPDNDEQGIIVAGLGVDGALYVLADRSCKLSPHGWASRAIAAYHEFNGDRLIAERNFGGEMVESTILQVDKNVPVKVITASRGKVQRAEPIAAIYEHIPARVHHVGAMPQLEDQLTTWTPQDGTSPDRLDALTWALTELTDGLGAQAWIEYMKRKAEAVGMEPRMATVESPDEPVVSEQPEPPTEPEPPASDIDLRRAARTAALRGNQFTTSSR